MAANPELKKVTFPALENVSAGILIDGDFDEYVFSFLFSYPYPYTLLAIDKEIIG